METYISSIVYFDAPPVVVFASNNEFHLGHLVVIILPHIWPAGDAAKDHPWLVLLDFHLD